MNRTIARDAVEIRNEIRKTEAAFDEALMQSAKLMQRMLKGRQNPGVNCDAGQSALAHLAKAQQQIIDGTSDVFRVHSELSKVARDIGMEKDDEDTVVPPPSGYQAASKREVPA
jgi:hypothetical protein